MYVTLLSPIVGQLIKQINYLSRDRRLNKMCTHARVFTCCTLQADHLYTENFSWRSGF